MNVFYGFDYLLNLLEMITILPIPSSGNVGNNVTMSSEDMLGDDNNPNGESHLQWGLNQFL